MQLNLQNILDETPFTEQPELYWLKPLPFKELRKRYPIPKSFDEWFTEQVPFGPRMIRGAQVAFPGEDKSLAWTILPGRPRNSLESYEFGVGGVGQTLDISGLKGVDQYMLVYCLSVSKKKLGAEGEKYMKAALERVPRVKDLSPIDVDFRDDVTWPEKYATARKISIALEEGLGIDRHSYSWRWTGKGGLHLSIEVEDGIGNPHLFSIVKLHGINKVTRAAVPHMHADGQQKKDTRPPAVIDDGIDNRSPSSRGINWRELGYERPNGNISLPVDVWSDSVLPLSSYKGPLVVSAQLYQKFLADWHEAKSEDVFRGTAKKEAKDSRPAKDLTFKNVSHLTSLNATARWISQNAPLAGPHDLRLAMSSALLRLGVPDSAVASVLAAGTGNLDDAKETVRSTKDRMASAFKCRGLPWIRRILGSDRVVDLGFALATDLGKGLFEVLSKVLGCDLISKNKSHVKFLLELNSSLSLETQKKVGKAIVRPTFCSVTADKVRTKDEGKLVYVCVHRCDAKSCPWCAMKKIEAERELVEKLWQGKGPFQIIEVENIPTMEALKQLQHKYLPRAGRPRIWSVGVKNGKFKALIVTNNGSDFRAVEGHCRSWTKQKGLEGCVLKDREVTDHLEAIDSVMLNKLSWHLFARDLIERHDSFLAKFLEDGYRVHLITSSRKGLKWPTGEQLKAEKQKELESKLDYEGQETYHDLTHLATDFLIHTQEHPHSFDQAMSLTNNSGALKAHIRSLSGQPSPVGTDAGGYFFVVQHDAVAVPIPA